MSEPKITVLYHNDADGFGAAYACWTVFGDEALYLPVQYGQPVPSIPKSVKTLYIVDFSYSRGECEALSCFYDKLVILDHHKTAEKELTGLGYARFDMGKSGAVMAWDYLWPGDTSPPLLLQYVQDRDLWKFELPNSEEVNLFIATLPFDFGVWDELAKDDTAFFNKAALSGTAIKAFRDRQIDSGLRGVQLVQFMGHAGVPLANVTANISEHGHKVLEVYPDAPFSVSYFDTFEGGVRKRVYSLRSTDSRVDVSALARLQGGGGHRNAAGFSQVIEEDMP